MSVQSPGASVLEIEGLSVDFPTAEGVVHAVRGVDLRLAPREVLGVVGESGSGKSVTALATMGLLPRNAKTQGSIRVKGTEVLGAKEKALMGLRGRTISMVFQDPMTSLNPVYSVGWQIAEALQAHQDIDKEEAMRRAVDLLTVVGIPNPKERAKDYPHAFSGGMRQRVVIAIAMANDPEIILADEPTTALDVTVQAQILEALKRALTETHSALVLITHDLGVIAGLADRVVVMYAGRAVETGPVDEIFYRPAMPYTVGLLGSLPRLDRDGTERLRPIPGSPPSLLGELRGCPFAPRCPMRVPEVCDVEEPALQPAGPQTGGVHLAACHFADKVAAGTTGPIFAATAVDLTDRVAAAEGELRTGP
ncbi:MAG: ABC transporter ATP-binding protein [Acidobacteriota bacterium]|nr:ABC transporter ATP-binding protein [Acidobacteriota bacterium]